MQAQTHKETHPRTRLPTHAYATHIHTHIIPERAHKHEGRWRRKTDRCLECLAGHLRRHHPGRLRGDVARTRVQVLPENIRIFSQLGLEPFGLLHTTEQPYGHPSWVPLPHRMTKTTKCVYKTSLHKPFHRENYSKLENNNGPNYPLLLHPYSSVGSHQLPKHMPRRMPKTVPVWEATQNLEIFLFFSVANFLTLFEMTELC